jgi:hypothetical protein
MSHTDTEHREQRGTRIGYTRVSTVSQTLDQQNEALTAANVTKTFSDTQAPSDLRSERQGRDCCAEFGSRQQQLGDVARSDRSA